ncbi:FAD dependent oxidoreductase [Penicillium italicum]|uniref:FAD dependent oxidoreductase n=1 Tax=Penicillium italicum TaxID=40296 RepID=A0A0A2KJZ6_PENIT|nr:FAD dependent oxidoreductase [Penicillium italicum]
MGVSRLDSIIIVGAGAFGLSVALHLALRGYKNVSVFAKDDYIPFGDLTNVVYRAAQDAGVRFFLGQQVDQIAFVSRLTGKRTAGVRTRNAEFHPSSLVIIEAGARDSDSSEIAQLHAPDPLAIPLSCYTAINANSFVEFVPQTLSSVILLSGNLVQPSKMSSVGPLVVDLLEAPSGQTAAQVQKGRTSPRPLSKL